jgi:hypothetical protein
MLKNGVVIEDHTTIGIPAYALRQTVKIPRNAYKHKLKLLFFPHPSAGSCAKNVNRRAKVSAVGTTLSSI